MKHPVELRDESQEIIPNSYVQSCSECCWYCGPDGGPNTAGALQRATYNCGNCPVHLATYHRPATTADGRHIYWKHSGKQLTENDLLKMQEDGDNILTFCHLK